MTNKNNTTNKSFGKRLQEYRLQKHWTLAKLAEKTELDKSALSRIENDLVTPTKLTVQKITDIFPQLSEVS